MPDIVKGVLVTVVCFLGALLQLEIGFATVEDATISIFMTLIIACPLGCGFGAIVGSLRSDRVLTLIGVLFSIMSVLFLFGSVTGDDMEWHASMFETYPWMLIGSLVLGWWTRPPVRLEVPAMRVRSNRIAVRRLTAVEISTLIALGCAIAITLGTQVGVSPYDAFDGETHTDRPTMLQRLLLFCTMAIPLGVAVGTVAARLSRLRLLLVPLTALVGVGYAWMLSIGVVDRIEFPAWSPLPVALALIAITRFAHPPRTTHA